MRRQMRFGFWAIGLLFAASPAGAMPVKKAPAKNTAVAKKVPVVKAKIAAQKPIAQKGGAGALAGQVQTYVTKHKLADRVVQVNLPGRKLTRTFVPILPDSYEDFMQAFSAKADSIIVRMYELDRIHSHLFFDVDKGIQHGNIWHAAAQDQRRIVDIREQPQYLQPGRFVALKLGKELLADATHYFMNATEPAGNKSGCMWWLTNATAGNTPLAHALGVSRSIDPGNLVAKLVHAGNERVAVIGVPVKTLAEFTAMSDAALMGNPPAGGALEAIRED